MRKSGALGFAVTAMLVAAPAAMAVPSVGWLKHSGGFSGVPLTFTYTGLAGGEQLWVYEDSYQIVFRDAGGGTIHANGCQGSDTSTVRCWTNGYQPVISIDAGVGDDKVDTLGWPGPVTLSGGDGADVLSGGAFNDVLSGGDGKDQLYGGDGDDRLISSDSTLQAADYLDCGPGTDTASWAAPDLAVNCESRI